VHTHSLLEKDCPMKCTIVLVHGAFAESDSWAGVIEPLEAEGHDVISAPNPLRGLAADAASVTDLVRTIEGPVVLVGHSYGGAVISNVAPDAGDVAGLVYVNGFAPAAGETAFSLANMFPGSTLGGALQPVSRRDGATDLYIAPQQFRQLFCADVSVRHAAVMAATQRPVTREALVEPSGEHPLWEQVPSWFLFGEEDRIIPVTLQHYMAARAHAQRTTAIEGASHAIPVSRPDATAHPILEAAALRVAV
jgi:pimeloyl-ACP methyl ester carboxylesterase